MHIELEPGKYVVAVSGGVDSVVLLDLLQLQIQQNKLKVKGKKFKDLGFQFVVGHYDHGVRAESAEDRKFVQSVAAQYGLEFFYEEGKLGPNVSEAVARQKRYDFLRRIKQQTGARAIITAHHQDDRIETAILNLLRGTGRRGLSSLRSTADIKRPLLGVRKQDLLAYARTHHLQWREDSTNRDERYARNRVRLRIMPKLAPKTRVRFLQLLDNTAALNEVIDGILDQLLAVHASPQTLDRRWLLTLSHDLSREVLITWLTRAGARQLDRRQVEQIVVMAKTLSHGKLIDVDAAWQLKINKDTLALIPRER